jgi:hypothetical protein
MGLKAGLDAMGKRKILPLPGIEPRPSSPSLIPTELSRILKMRRFMLKI